MESDTTRRDFLKSAAKTTAGLGALGGITFLGHPERVFGANDRVRVAVCGLHGRGKDHLSAFSHLSNVEIAALCDVDENVLRKRLGEVSGKPQSYVDFRKLLNVFLLDKALYEVLYELNSRPAWVRIPLMGIRLLVP